MTKLLAKKPGEATPRKPKICIYGKAGVGKTFASCQFPRPYFIDCEGGASYEQYQHMIAEGGGVYLGIEDGSLDWRTLFQQIEALATEEHPYNTLIIDSLSKIWDTTIAAELDRMKKAGETPAFGSENKPAVQNFRNLMRLLQRIDMNVVLVAAEKAVWKNGEQVGTTPNCWDRVPYELDAIAEIELSKGRRIARITKNRLPQLHGQKEPILLEFSRDSIYELFGAELLESQTKPLEIASKESVGEMVSLCDDLEVSDSEKQKWLNKANCSNFSEMEQHQVDAVINMLKKKAKK